MPGIVGLITKMPRDWALPQLMRMVETLRYESFYVTGTWTDESLGIYVGWAARKGSFSDGMPLLNEEQNLVLTFSGEEFPAPRTVPNLGAKGHLLAPGAASYLVHLAEEHPDFPVSLNGTFQGLLVDRKRETAKLFNDRYGMHRLCYHEAKEAFYFAAEPKAILAVRVELRRLDSQGLAESAACGCVLEDRTIFHAIHALPPGSAWIFRNGSLETKGIYFNPREWETQGELEPEAWYDDLRKVFTQNLPRYFNGPERIGISLTGGLDTRMIMAWLNGASGAMSCYTFGGSYRDCRDVVVARQVARLCKLPHQVIPVGRDFLSRFSHYAERTVYLSDGSVEVNRSPALYANEKARAIAPVRMTGNYGSQVLRAATPSEPRAPLPAFLSRDLLPQFHSARTLYVDLLRTHPLSFTVFRQVPWRHRGLFALEQTQLSQRSPFLDNDLVQIAFRAPAPVLAGNDASLRLIADGSAALRRIPTDRGLAGNHGRMSAAFSRNCLEATFKAEYAYDYGMPQWVARADYLCSPLHLERLFLGRHKFYHFRVWYKDQLSRYIQEVLLDSRTLSRPFFNRIGLESMVRGHVKGNRNYTTWIHSALTMELIHRLFVDLK